MKLLISLQNFTKDVQIKLVDDATELGAIKTLQALRAIVIEKLEK